MAERSRTRSDRPAKPYPDFPLFPHATRRWAKKIRGRFAFFGPWEDPQGALERYLAQRDHLFAGVTPPAQLGNEIGRVRSIFKHGFEANLMDKPVRYGPEFRKPAKRAVRLARKASGLRMYEAAEIHALLDAAGPQLRAMILLGVNCGMGNTDVAALTRSVVNLKTRVVEFPRPKTGIARRAVLWPETVAALRGLQKTRPAPKQPEDADLVFVTRFGQPWVRVTTPGARSKGKHQAVVKDSVAMEFRKVARAAGADRDGRGFYALRHTFRTIADEVGDRRAVDLVMGHENGADIANHYVERIGDDRLEAVAEHVRAWLGTA